MFFAPGTGADPPLDHQSDGQSNQRNLSVAPASWSRFLRNFDNDLHHITSGGIKILIFTYRNQKIVALISRHLRTLSQISDLVAICSNGGQTFQHHVPSCEWFACFQNFERLLSWGWVLFLLVFFYGISHTAWFREINDAGSGVLGSGRKASQATQGPGYFLIRSIELFLIRRPFLTGIVIFYAQETVLFRFEPETARLALLAN
jgi:hypothetical protein